MSTDSGSLTHHSSVVYPLIKDEFQIATCFDVVIVDDLVASAKGNVVRDHLMHSTDNVFRPNHNDVKDPSRLQAVRFDELVSREVCRDPIKRS